MGQGRRTAPLPEGWKHLRAQILHRDRGRCRTCGAIATQVDHIIPAHAGGTDAPPNLAAICTPCHLSKTGREARAVQPKRKRPDEPHPGLT